MKISLSHQKIAIISDIHGNKIALSKFFNYLETDPVDFILNLGDNVGIGPNPKEVLNVILKDQRFINVLGNNDIALWDLDTQTPNRGNQDHYNWMRQEVGEDLIRSVKKNIPKTQNLTIHNKKILMVHSRLPKYSCWDNPLIYQNQSLENFAQDYPKDVNIVLFGHMHEQALFRAKNKILLNPGALGCSKDHGFASFCIINFLNEVPDIQFKNIPYNEKLIRDALRRKKIPDNEFLIEYFYPE